jgi:hypothetical protein
VDISIDCCLRGGIFEFLYPVLTAAIATNITVYDPCLLSMQSPTVELYYLRSKSLTLANLILDFLRWIVMLTCVRTCMSFDRALQHGITPILAIAVVHTPEIQIGK